MKYFVQDVIDEIDRISKGGLMFNLEGVNLDSFHLKKELRRFMLKEDSDTITDMELGLILNAGSDTAINGEQKEKLTEALASDKLFFNIKVVNEGSTALLIIRNNVGFAIYPDSSYKLLSKLSYDAFRIPEKKKVFTMPLDVYRHAKTVHEKMIENDAVLKLYFASIYDNLIIWSE